MATGDDALAAGMDILDGNELANTIDTEINKSRDYIAQRTAAVTPIAKGGTGASDAAAARANLEAVGTIDVYNGQADRSNKLVKYNSGSTITTFDPTANGHAATKRYVDEKFDAIPTPPAGVPSSGGTFTGNVYFPNSSAATNSYTVAYINGDGRLSRGASSERYKKFISEIDPASLGDVWPDLVRYQMRLGDGSWKYGYIAERLEESDALRPFVVYLTATEYDATTDTTSTRLVTDENGNPMPDSIDFISLLMVQNAQLHDEVAELRLWREEANARLTALEARDATN